jgi:hypothetical protein
MDLGLDDLMSNDKFCFMGTVCTKQESKTRAKAGFPSP